MRLVLSTAAALTVALAASAASAQEAAPISSTWTGFYVGGSLGYSWQPPSSDERIGFDRALPIGSPTFCGGAPTSNLPASGCTKDNDATVWKIHAGYDYQFSGTSDWINHLVLGGVLEYGEAYLYDSVTAYTREPATYRIKSKLKGNGSLRGRAGYTFDTGTFLYGTGGFAFGKIKNSFTTTNTTDLFTTGDGSKNATGYNYGGGIEQRIGPISIGTLYLFTVLSNNDFDVNAARGAVVNPLSLVGSPGAGVNFKRSFSKYGYHAIMATVSYHFQL